MNAIVVILLTLGAAAAMPLGFQKDKRYTYSYQSEVSHAIPTGSQKTLGLRVKSQAHVDVIKKTEIQITLANVQVLQVTGNLRDSKEQEKPANEKILEAMQEKLKLPVKVSFKPQDGSIKEIKAHPKDEEWSRNIKRGLANLFQISANIKLEEKNGKQFITQHESTAVGDCQVSYVVNLENSKQGKKDQVCKITKVINYEKCRRRPQFSQNTFYGRNCEGCQQSMGYAPYLRSVGQIDHTLTGSKVDGFVISRTEAFEQHVITPFSRSGGQVTASSRQMLQFLKTDAVGQDSPEVTKLISQTCTAEDPDKSARDDAQHQQSLAQQAQILIEEMCKAAKDPVRQQAAQKFTAVVLQLRKCNMDSLKMLVDHMPKKQDSIERKYCLDALSYVGTSEAFQVLKQKITTDKEISKQELQRMLLGLAFAPRPTVDHIEAVWALCEQFAASKDTTNHRHCFLSFGALVHKINQRSNLQQDTKTITTCQQRIKDILDRLKDPETSQQDRLTYIKALGNAGSTEAQQQLLDNFKDQTQPLHIRINCVWALRRIATQSREETYPRLISTFVDAKENPELRMAVFLLILNSKPNFATMQALANTVRLEMINQKQGPRSNQLASFVISHLFSLAYHSNVLMKTRSMQARLAMRVLPRMSFGLEYSKGMRWAQYSEKFQAGFEFEANKFNVPDSMLPRNMNARLQLSLLGYKMDAIEFGSRVENLDDVIEQVISKVRRRQKRSLFASVWSSLFSGKVSDDDSNTTEKPTGRSTRAVSKSMSRRRRETATPSGSMTKQYNHRRTTSRPTTRPTTRPMTTRPSYSVKQAKKQQRASVYMKLFGDEVKFAELTQEHVDQLANDIADLLLGKKDRIEYPSLGIVISKDGVAINQNLEKAMLLANARHMLTTLAGIPLDLQLRSSAALRMNTVANVNIGASLLSFWYFKKFNGNVEINPSVHVHADSRIGIHTPYLRVGLWMRKTAQSDQKVHFTVESGKQYQLTYNIPQDRRDVARVKASTQGFAEQYDPKSCERTEQQISMDLTTSHLKRVQKSCAGQDMFGVQLCAAAQVPDIASLRLQQIPVLSAFGQTDVRVSMEPSSDKPASIQLTGVVKNDEKAMQADGQISASSKTVQRRIPYKVTYRKGNQKQLEFESKLLQVQGCEDCRMKVTANRDGLTVQFGKGKAQYEITASGQIQNQGKNLHLQAQWTELPEEWKKFFYNWQPQIWYFLQQFAWIRRTEQKTKQIAFEFQLTTPLTADLKLKTPDAEAMRTNLFLPVRIERLPQSLKDVGNYYYAHCEVQDQTVKVFDHQQYQHNIRGECLYTLVQEHRKDKQSRIQLSAKIGEQGQKTVVLSIQQQQQQSKETVEVKQDSTILIDGQKQECSQKACQSKHGGATVQKVHTSDGKTQIRLSTKLGLYATIEGPRIQVSASPFLRSRVRGLCGDADGEQWDDYRDPQDQLQNLQKFIQSWRQQC